MSPSGGFYEDDLSCYECKGREQRAWPIPTITVAIILTQCAYTCFEKNKAICNQTGPTTFLPSEQSQQTFTNLHLKVSVC